ncbi:MAG: HD domain-containing protein [Candidatus Diapherotrites archaeon]|uniref:5'-deoxynucleotidase n=1 Tax=Candidatus Iainarchaeum sp. TaxID=3101447 RepID=A0A8T4KUR3_9ARCH|nr:HD domain-containing protein [Candidatus Diapherotrites archaeon]
MNSEKALIEFFQNAGKLKNIKRTGWKLMGIKNPESVAEHSFRLAVMAFALAPRFGLDAEKCAVLALIHDLPEAYTGDISHAGVPGKQQIANENKAMKKLIAKLEPKTKNGILKLWNEFIDEKSREAELIQQLDKLEMALQAFYYEKKKFTRRSLQVFFDDANLQITDKRLLKMLHALNDMRSR